MPGRLPFPGAGKGTGGRAAVTLIELLCVLAIIGILVTLLLGPVGRALGKARRLKAEIEIPAHVERLTDGMRKFAAAHVAYQCPDLDALIEFARPGGPTERWLRGQKPGFKPFQHDSPDDQIVLRVRFPSDGGYRMIELSKKDLTVIPE